VYEEVIAFALEHDLIVIHDNAYSDIVFDGPAGGSFLSYPGALEVGVEFLSLSKSFNVTGARLSFLVGRPDVVAAARKLRGQIDFGMFHPEQDAAIAALTGPRDSVERQRLLYQERRDALCDGLEAIGWEHPNAHGSMFVWARIPCGRQDSTAFA
ncbi:aminotransferase class I/II-fold pyridoxal phosphate-dependent enzyme, partial [Bacteroides mediterraneensis]